MPYPILAPSNTWYKSSVARSTVTEINIVDSYTLTGSEDESWNADTDNSGSIKCYRTGTVLTIAGNGSGKIAMNADSSYLFSYSISSTSQTDKLFISCTSINGLDLFDSSSVTNMRSVFAYCISLTELDLSTWDVSNVTTLRYAFGANEGVGVMSLTTLNVSGWNISSKCTSLRTMFQNCPSLITVDVSNWDTSNVTDMSYMFYGCSSLQEVDVSKWQTGVCTDMNRMFAACISLETLDVSNWDTSKVTTFKSMFQAADSSTPMKIKKLDVSKWNTSSATDMSFMFYACQGPKTIDVSNWDVSNVTNFDHMFAHSLLKIGDTKNWHVSAACTNLNAAFHCTQNTTFDVSNFDTSNVQFFCQMFEGCSALKNIIGLENFDTSSGVGFEQMFSKCTELTELNLSSFDTTHAKDGVTSSTNGHATATLQLMFNEMPNLEKITLGDKFSFNGDGTTTIADNIAVLPTPSSSVIAGATGKWYTQNRTAYDPSNIPNRTAMTYYASLPLVNNIDLLVKNGSLLNVADKVRDLSGVAGSMSLSDMVTNLNFISKRASGTILAGTSDVNVNVGFQPDIVILNGFTYNVNSVNYQLQMCFVFAEKDNSNECMVLSRDNDNHLIEAVMTQTSTGFALSTFNCYDENGETNTIDAKTYSYVAIKYPQSKPIISYGMLRPRENTYDINFGLKWSEVDTIVVDLFGVSEYNRNILFCTINGPYIGMDGGASFISSSLTNFQSSATPAEIVDGNRHVITFNFSSNVESEICTTWDSAWAKDVYYVSVQFWKNGELLREFKPSQSDFYDDGTNISVQYMTDTVTGTTIGTKNLTRWDVEEAP